MPIKKKVKKSKAKKAPTKKRKAKSALWVAEGAGKNTLWLADGLDAKPIFRDGKLLNRAPSKPAPSLKAVPITKPDLRVSNEGSLFLLHPESEAGQAWIDEHIPKDSQFMGKAVAVEPRYIGDLVIRAQQDGMEVK